MRFGIVRFPGSNCDADCRRAVQEGLGEDAFYLWHRDRDLGGADAILLPGGFAYGDYLRAGAIARFSPIMKAVESFARAGGPVLGICNGFQILCEAGLLPGALARNAGLRFLSHDVHLSVERTDTAFTSAYRRGQVLRMPLSHGEGRFVADASTLDLLEEEGRVVFRYVDREGNATANANPNGSLRAIAGVCNEARNVVGLMPHPDRAYAAVLGSDDGLGVFRSALAATAAAAS
jgi:phosphoribosylformylglycinamidine synthase